MDSPETEQRMAAGPPDEVLDVIEERWSPRSFADRPVPPETLHRLLDAARRAPSSYNEQPWRFLVARKEDGEPWGEILACLTENNRRWADSAPVLMLTVAKLRFDRNGRENRHAFHDVGLAMGNLLTQATAEGLYVHQMAGILPEEARRRFAIPEGFEAVAGVAIGFLGDPEELDEDLRERERSRRSRKPLQDLVFSGRWGRRAPFV